MIRNISVTHTLLSLSLSLMLSIDTAATQRRVFDNNFYLRKTRGNYKLDGTSTSCACGV